MNNNKFSAEFFDHRFTVYRKDRCDSNINAIQGGGVLIAIDSKYDSEPVTLPELEPLEAVWIKVHLKSSDTYMFVYGLYSQCHSPESVYSSHLKAIIAAHSLIKHGFDYLPLIGTSESERANIARNMTLSLLNCGLFQMADLINKSGNDLDLAYTNMPELFVVNHADIPLIPEALQDSVHIQTHCTIECEPSTYVSSPSSEKMYCFKRAPFDLIREELANIDFIDQFADKSLDDMLNALYNKFYEIFDFQIPQSTLRTSNHPVWYDKKLINLKNRRSRAYNKYRDKHIKSKTKKLIKMSTTLRLHRPSMSLRHISLNFGMTI